jgi:hypothetical protein
MVLVLCAGSGCAVFRPPQQSGSAPTVATGRPSSESEQWAAEAMAQKAKSDKEAFAKTMERIKNAESR